jgi:hypothetical protein
MYMTLYARYLPQRSYENIVIYEELPQLAKELRQLAA